VAGGVIGDDGGLFVVLDIEGQSLFPLRVA
jgi:hypothetical protein